VHRFPWGSATLKPDFEVQDAGMTSENGLMTVVVRKGAVEDVWTSTPLQVALFDQDTQGADDARRIPTLSDQPGRWEEELGRPHAERVFALCREISEEDAPAPEAGAPSASRVILTLVDGQISDALSDGNIRILVIDRDAQDPDVALTFTDEEAVFGLSQSFQASAEWLAPVQDPLRVTMAFKEAEAVDWEPAVEPTPRRRRSP
jgi:hypothetical protein